MKNSSCVQNLWSTGVLSLIFLLGLAFLLTPTQAYAHVVDNVGTVGDKEAKDVDVKDENDVREFLTHVSEHYASTLAKFRAQPFRGLSTISREFRKPGVYKTDEMYVIMIDSGGTVLNHSAYPNLFGWKSPQVDNMAGGGGHLQMH